MKRDIKYILKRVIIGVLIGLIFAFINKYSVHAEELPSAFVNLFGYNLNEITSSPFNNPPNIITTFEYSSYNINVNYVANNNYVYYILFEDSNNYYLITSNNFGSSCFNNQNFDSINFTDSNIDYLNNNNILCSSSSPMFFEVRIFSTSSINNNNIYLDLINNKNMVSSYTNNYNNSFNYSVLHFDNPDNTTLNVYNAIDYISSNLDFVSSSVPIYLDNNELAPLIPSNYSQIDLNDYQAVYFVPKNYSTTSYTYLPVGCSQNDDVCEKFYEFNYYYQGSIKYSPISIEDTNIYLYSKTSSDYYEEEITYREDYFPFSDGVNYYYVPLIQNGNYTKESHVWYDTTLFDYYIVDDMTNYSQHLCFIGKDDVELCINFTLNKTLEDYWQQGIDAGGNSFNEENQDFKGLVGAIFGIFSAPFDFLKKISNGSCSSFNIPIPFINSNISINCLSPVFKRILGNFFTTFQLLLSGLIVYRITILNFYCINDIMMLKSDKIEVVDL